MLNLEHLQNGNRLWIKDMDTGRFTNIYVYPEWADGNKYGIVDDTGCISYACSERMCREIVLDFFQANKPDELEALMNKCGYVKMGYS